MNPYNKTNRAASGISRRQALQTLGGSMGAALLGPGLFGMLGNQASAASPLRFNARANKLVLLWLEGGPSQLDTFDPKPGTETGGPLKAIDTDVEGWQFSEALPGLAKRAEDLCVIRSMTSREGNHSRARLLVKTGYVPNPTMSHPSLGAIVCRELGNPQAELPNYVQVNGAPSPAGYMGVANAPLVIKNPNDEIENLDYARGVGPRRMQQREAMLEILEDEYENRGGLEPVAANRQLRARSRKLMDTKLLKAFDLEQEKNATRSRYGDNKFGQGCLLARRLLESGVTAVEVVLGGWDTHDDNFNRVKTLSSQLDPGYSELIDDLKRTGLDKDTLVVCMGEFGRTPRITATDGRGHWPSNWCVSMFGAGVKSGMGYGQTDASGEKIVEHPVSVPDLYATFSHLLGFDPDKEEVVAKRPITLVDADGKIVRDIVTS